MKPYKIAVNLEWTSKCNARCVMCPQDRIQHQQLMTEQTFHKALERLSPEDVFRTVIAGYGEPTTHPKFMQFVSAVRDHPAHFDMVSNGQLLDVERLKHLDGSIGQLVISFSSISPDVYQQVHVNLDLDKVKENICNAQKTFKKTRLTISLTPLQECIETLPQTIQWLKNNGVTSLSMSPTLYNRGGNITDHAISSRRLRDIIETHELHSQELDFVPSIKDTLLQTLKNRFKCLPRNSDLFITSSGKYLYCYNDVSHGHTIGDIHSINIREAVSIREKLPAINELCDNCNMRNRYRPAEIFQVGAKYILKQIRA